LVLSFIITVIIISIINEYNVVQQHGCSLAQHQQLTASDSVNIYRSERARTANSIAACNGLSQYCCKKECTAAVGKVP